MELVPGKEMRSAVDGTTTDTSLKITVNRADASEVKVDGSMVKPSAAEPEIQNQFFDTKDLDGGQSILPKTGVGIGRKMVALWIVILLDVAFLAWLVWKNKQKRWPS